MNFKQLTAFRTIAQFGSFRRAAEHLHLSQPALTVQIRQLEKALGVRLLDRNTRSVSVTQVGRQLLPTLERVLGELDAVLLNTREIAARRRGVVTIAALPSISATVLPGAIAAFRRRFPGISVRLKDTVAQEVVNLVKSGEVDLGVSSLPKADPAIRIARLMDDRMVVVFPAGHAFERRRAVSLADLREVPLILMNLGSSVRSLVDRAFEDAGEPAVPAYEAAYISTALAMVRAGLGVTIQPSTAAAFEGTRGLGSRPIRDGGLTRSIGILEQKDRTRSPAAQSFVEVLGEITRARV